jgi:DNA polymerase III epsilon subunit-like protein
MVEAVVESGSVTLADALASAWQRYDAERPMPEWFCGTSEMLRGFASRQVLPEDYLVVDFETTGFDPNSDYIVEIGWAEIRQRRITDSGYQLLDWSAMPVSKEDFCRRLEKARNGMVSQGKDYRFTWDMLCQEGVAAWQGLGELVHRLFNCIENGVCIVGHNLWRFDRAMLNGYMDRFMDGYRLPWRPNSVLDTGLMEKAAGLNYPPYAAETLDDWFARINAQRIRGVTWSLDRHCTQKYALAERYHLDMAHAHQAAFDCVCTSHLLETYRQLISALSAAGKD